MSVPLDRTRSNDLTLEAWVDSWEVYHWRDKIGVTLRDIIYSWDAAGEHRVGALKLLNDATRTGLLPPDDTLPDLTCRILLYVAQGDFEIPWWRRFGLTRRRRVISDRLYAARVMLLTASQFIVNTYETHAFTVPQGLAS